MRILHLSSEFPPEEVFGLGRYVEEISRAQVALGHEVHVLTNSIGGRDPDIDVEGVRINRIHFPPPPKPFGSTAPAVQFNQMLLDRFWELMPAMEPLDVVVAHDWLTAMAGRAAATVSGARLVVTLHDTVVGKRFGRLEGDDQYVAQVERWAAGTADRVVTLSSFLRDELVSTYGAERDRIAVVYGARLN